MTEQSQPDAARQEDFNRRLNLFLPEYQALQEKHGIVPLAVTKVTMFGIVPDINYFDKATLEKNAGTQSAPSAELIKE